MSYTAVEQNMDGEIVDNLVTPGDTTIYIRENTKEKIRLVQRIFTRYRHLRVRALILFLLMLFLLYVLMDSSVDLPKGNFRFLLFVSVSAGVCTLFVIAGIQMGMGMKSTTPAPTKNP